MSFLGGAKPDPFEPGKTERENKQKAAEQAGGKPPADENDPRKPTMTRVAIWLVAGGFGLYLLGSGIFQLITQGG
ncbi:hypothetical protein ACEXQD_18575 [Herbiconiux sp. P15]|uniref:hypothetical protein n=1 Tax=Herbiconiux liukaitaii TaxID=3342799 RepID=UPI0035B8143C